MRFKGSLCGHYDDGDKDDKSGKSAYNGNTHFEGALHIFLVHFFTFTARLRREIPVFLFFFTEIE